MPILGDYPLVPIHIADSETLYNVLDWQRVGAKVMLRHFLKSDMYFQATLNELYLPVMLKTVFGQLLPEKFSGSTTDHENYFSLSLDQKYYK